MSDLAILAYQAGLFSFIATVTPGPNNIMLLASGANYGYRRTVPHILGVNIGYNALILSCGLGLAALFSRFPLLQEILRYAGSAYLLYLAWRILQAARPKADNSARPFRFIEAFLFQYVNPKAWVLAVTIIVGFTSADGAPTEPGVMRQMAAILAVTVPLSYMVSSVWVLFGVAIANFLQNDRNRKIFNIAMAILLLLTIYWIIN